MKSNNPFVVKKIHKVEAIELIQKYHYSPVMPGITKYYLGLFLDNKLKGVLTLGWGTKPRHTFNKMFPSVGVLDTNDNDEFIHDINDWYYEIGKMCLSDDLNKNKIAGSQMVSAVIKWIKENTDCKFLYTMADGIMGKCGFVYQASNFYYGEKYFTSVYLMENGEKLHPRTSNQLCIENAKFLNKEKVFWLTTDFMKLKGIRRIDGLMFRYIYPLNKKAKKMLKLSSMEWTKNYPKVKDLEWRDVTDRKNKKTISQPAFTFENAKYNLKNINAHKKSTLNEFF
tara:strand:+ start:763 stop:1611 length:849 start_codon:yes stop_codon:yes gene_type:complete